MSLDVDPGTQEDKHHVGMVTARVEQPIPYYLPKASAMAS